MAKSSPFVTLILAGLLLVTVNAQFYDFVGTESDEEPSTINVATAIEDDGIGDRNHNPFDVEAVVRGVNPNSFSFFESGDPFFNNYPFFPFTGFTGVRKQQWWKGPNVCTERIESEEEKPTTASRREESETNEESGSSGLVGQAASFFSGFQVTLNSCVEKSHKHVCKQVYNRNGKKKTLTVTRQCCHGYGRTRESDLYAPCEQLELKPIVDTAEEMGAKEFMKTARSNGLDEMLATNLTVFLPTDSAFTEFSEQMFENNLVVLPQARRIQRAVSDSSVGYTTKDLALNHMVDGWINIEDIENEELLQTNYKNSTIRINVFPGVSVENRYRYTANCVPIVKYNKFATNGMIHVVDRVLQPVTVSVMDIIKEREDMSVLRTILEKTKLNELLMGDKPVTIFAPTDKAFQKLDQQLRRTLKEGKSCAVNILKNHILDMSFCSMAVITDAKTTAYNILGTEMLFERTSQKDSSNDSEIADLNGIQEILINGQAKILETDLMGTNGVIHVIDTIMPTDSGLPITSILEKKNLTIFKNLIEASNIQDEYDDLNNVTFFVPTDKAFDGTIWKKKLNETPNELKDNKELKEFLNYHIAEPMTKTCELSEKLMDSKFGPQLRINLYSTHDLFSHIMNRATVNCGRLIHFDDESCGSVLHQVDKVLTPPKSNLLEKLESNPNYSKFLELLKEANLTEILQDDNNSYTILLPKNDVFDESDDWLKNLSENPEKLNDFVKTHIVNDVVCCAGIIPTSFPFVRRIESINNEHLRINRDRRPKIENASVTKCDIIATNGIIHEINDVIQIKRRTQSNRPLQPFGSFGGFGDLIFKK